MEDGKAGVGGKQDTTGGNNKNLIINYLPQALTDNEFSNMFSSVGAIKQCRIMRNMQSNYSFGYGFVEYANPEDADRAIAQLDGLQVQNKKIKVSYARPPGQDIKDTNLYIQNLPRNIDETYLDRLFSPFGEIVQRRLLLDKYTQLPRGVGFVRFGKRAEAQRAIEQMNGTIPEGGTQPLNVKVAEDYSKTKQMTMMQQHGGFPGYGMGGRGGGPGQFGRGRGGGRGGRGGPAARGGYGIAPATYEAPQAAKPYGTDYSGGYGGYTGGYGDYGTADSVDYTGGYGDYTGGYGAPAAAGAGDSTAWPAARGMPRRGGRGFNKSMPYKSNNRFNPMGSGF